MFERDNTTKSPETPVPEILGPQENASPSTPASYGAANSSSPPPGFDLASLRVEQSYASGATTKLLTTVPITKPDKTTWVRVHPDEDYRALFLLLDLRDERQTFLLHPSLANAVGNAAVFKMVYAGVNMRNEPFLWPIRFPGPDGRIDNYNRSAMEAAGRAMSEWVRVEANQSLGAYDIFVPKAERPDPVWPKEPFARLVEVAFRGLVIHSADHPALKRLRGEW